MITVVRLCHKVVFHPITSSILCHNPCELESNPDPCDLDHNPDHPQNVIDCSLAPRRTSGDSFVQIRSLFIK